MTVDLPGSVTAGCFFQDQPLMHPADADVAVAVPVHLQVNEAHAASSLQQQQLHRDNSSTDGHKDSTLVVLSHRDGSSID
jgi:hypothetical protein